MYRQLLRCKIHRATVTESNLEYEGSMTIDEELMDQISKGMPQLHQWLRHC